MTLKKPVDWDQLYPGRFIKAGNLLGKKATVTISSVDLDELEGDKGKKIKGIISFKESTLQLALNKTNGICLKAMFGRKLADWEGKRITLFPSQWSGEDCIRIWGSPDIEKDIQVTVALSRKKPFDMTMHKVVKGEAQPPPSDAVQDGEQAGAP